MIRRRLGSSENKFGSGAGSPSKAILAVRRHLWLPLVLASCYVSVAVDFSVALVSHGYLVEETFGLVLEVEEAIQVDNKKVSLTR